MGNILHLHLFCFSRQESNETTSSALKPALFNHVTPPSGSYSTASVAAQASVDIRVKPLVTVLGALRVVNVVRPPTGRQPFHNIPSCGLFMFSPAHIYPVLPFTTQLRLEKRITHGRCLDETTQWDGARCTTKSEICSCVDDSLTAL